MDQLFVRFLYLPKLAFNHNWQKHHIHPSFCVNSRVGEEGKVIG